MDLKETLSFYRKAQGLSQIDLANALEVSRQTVSKWETGAVLPSAENLLALSKLYGVPVDTLLNAQAAVPPSPETPPEPGRFPTVQTLSGEQKSPFRRRFLLPLLGTIFLFDLVMFLLEFYLHFVVGSISMVSTLLRILGGCLIGLAFAWRDREQTNSRKASLLIGLAALALGLYVFLLPAPPLWQLYNLVAWIGSASSDALYPSNPLFFFLGWTLADEYAACSHLLLISSFQLGRLWFSRKKQAVIHPQPLPHT